MASSNIYDLKAVKEEIVNTESILKMQIKILALIEILKELNIITDLDVEAAEKYISGFPQFQEKINYIAKSKEQISYYSSHPEQHLRDLYKAKMEGKI